MRKVNVASIGGQLFSPFSYLTKFEHAAKGWYDVWYPLFFTCLTMLFLFFVVGGASIPSLIVDINGFLGSLPGFFIAALAAIATFGNSRIDKEVRGVKVKIKDASGLPKSLPVSRRRFLSSMFSYLTCMSFLTVLGTNVALRVKINQPEVELIVNWVGFSTFFFIVWQIVLTTFLGLYYLGERLHEAE